MTDSRGNSESEFEQENTKHIDLIGNRYYNNRANFVYGSYFKR